MDLIASDLLQPVSKLIRETGIAPMSCCFRRGLVLVKQTADPGSNPRSSKKRGKMTIPAKHSQIVVVVPFYSQALGVKIK